MRVLVVAPNWIGDALMAQPLFARLREKTPQLTLDVLAASWVAPVLARMPEVSEVMAAPLRHGGLDLALRWRIGRQLRQQAYDEAIVLPNSWKSALVPLFAGIPVRRGYLGEARYGLINRRLKASGAPMSEHYARLAGPGEAKLAAPRLRVDPGAVDAVRRRFGLPERYVAFCPGAEYGPAKRWPYFPLLARQLKEPVVVLGSAKDAAAAQGIEGIDLTGKTTLDEAIDLLAGAASVVSNDSGLMHVAAALGRPQVALFGSSSPRHTPPLSPAARVVWLGLACSPCFQRDCPLGHFRCMREMTVESVRQEIENLAA